MELMWLVYGISVLNGVGIVSAIVLLLSLVGALFAGVFFWVSTGGIKFPYIKSLAATIIVSTFVTILVPNEKTMYTMAGAYATQKVAEAPETKEIATKVLVIINEKLDAMVKK